MITDDVFKESVFYFSRVFVSFVLNEAMDTVGVFDNVFKLRIDGKAVRDMLIAVEDCFKVSVNRSRHFVVFFFINSSVMLRKDTDDCSKLINGACCHVVFPVINEDNASSINMINDRVKCLIFHQYFSSQIFQYFFEVTDKSPMLNTINTIPMIRIRMIT